MLDFDIMTLKRLRSTVLKLLYDINTEIDLFYTYEDDNCIIKMNDEIENIIDEFCQEFEISFLP